MRVLLADRSFLVVAVKKTGQMVSSFALFSKTCLVIAVTILPSGNLGAVIRVGAAMSHIICLAFACKEMLPGLAIVLSSLGLTGIDDTFLAFIAIHIGCFEIGRTYR